MSRPNYGSSVANGKVRYLSASSLTLADPDSEEGCLRKFYYEKVEGRRAPSTGPQQIGVALHAEIESYLRTGVNILGSLALRGKFMLPEPGPDLLIEHDMMISPARAFEATISGTEVRGDLAQAPLTILGIPAVGYIDLLHARGTNKGVPDIEDTIDPPDTVEVIDWKTTSKPQYMKTPEAMARSIQMTMYGKWVTTAIPSAAHVRLSHGYFPTRGNALPRKVSLRVLPEQIDQQWARIERVAGSIVDVVKESSADRVPANTRACNAYGGCPHREYCRAAARESLVYMFGPEGADNIIRRMTVNTPPQPQRLVTRGLVKPAVREEMSRVAREEIAAKYPGIPEAWDMLKACNLGHPEFDGELARVVGELTGTIGIKHLDGVGELGTYGPFSNPAELPGLVAEVKLFMLADGEHQTTQTTTAPDAQVIELLPPDAPPSDPSLAAKSAETPTVGQVTVKKGRGRPRKNRTVDVTLPGPDPDQLSLPSMDVAATPDVMAISNLEDHSTVVVESPDRLFFYVNCRPSCSHVSFWPVVNEIIDDLNRASSEALDFRLVANDHAFAYGRWKGAIAAALRTAALAPLHYVLDGASGEIAIAVTEAMRLIVAQRNGVYIE